MSDFRNRLEKGPVIFDGAMGTYVSALSETFSGRCEEANIEDPELILRVHREYIEAGAMAITANTFAADRIEAGRDKAAKMIEKGMEIAFAAAWEAKEAGKEVSVFADIGQLNMLDELRAEEYTWQAGEMIKAGARNFIFETQSGWGGICEAAGYIREQVPDAYIIASFSINDAGFTQEGYFSGDLLKTFHEVNAEGRLLIDAIGFNCGVSAGHMQRILEKLNFEGTEVFVKPNAGYPEVRNRRTVYEGDPVYFADMVHYMAMHGVKMAGGCCGTTPAHIAQIVRVFEGIDNDRVSRNRQTPGIEKKEDEEGSLFWNRLISGQKPVAVELDPPSDADLTRFMNGVRELKEAHADIITIADCPIGRARMDSSLLACKVRREEGIEALPHMTCRDRNLNATQALMLGLYAEGVRNILLVTGDPVPTLERDVVKAVYQFNSRKFAAFARSLSERMFPSQVHFFGALNVNAVNFDIQLGLAKEKIENGITGFLTQPVLTEAAFENLKRAKEELSGYILGGIIPVVSEKNARFMNSEINGINIDERVCDMYAGKSREESEDLAVSICTEIARRIAPYVDGYYFMTPFLRTGLIKRILENMKSAIDMAQ